MKITCQACQAKYTIADEKIAGKTVKIKCKKCNAAIVINAGEDPSAAHAPVGGNLEPGFSADAPGQGAGGHDDDVEGATRVIAAGPPTRGGGGGGDEWTVAVTDDDQRPFAPAQIVVEFSRGVIKLDTFVWKEGMADWLPLSGVPELMQLLGNPKANAGPSPSKASQPQAVGGGGVASAAAAAAGPAAAARRKAAAGAVDLFNPGDRPETPSQSAAVSSADRLVGERNENSVLFSITALTASTKAANEPPGAGARKKSADAALDELMNLAGGVSGAPVLAAPPLLTPVAEPPKPPVIAAAPVVPIAGSPHASAFPTPEKKSSPAGIILGIGGGLALVASVAFFFVMKSGGAPAATGEASSASAASSAVAAAPTGGSVSAGASTGSADGPGARDPKPASAAAATASVARVLGPLPVAKPGDSKPSDIKPVADLKPVGPVDKPADVKPVEKPADKPADNAGGQRDFDRAAAMSALSAAAGAAARCKKDDGPTGAGRVKVTFAPSGSVANASVEGGSFAGTPVGGCIAAAFRGAHVPPFDGSPVAVSKSFNIN